MTSVTDPLLRTTTTTFDGMPEDVDDRRGHASDVLYIRSERSSPRDGLRRHLGGARHVRRFRTTRSSKDQTGATTLYGYDDEGQLISVTDALGNVTQYAYDPNGNLMAVTDADEHTTTYMYDPANRKSERKLPLGNTETFGYDLVGNNISHTDFRGKTTTYAYDLRNRMLSKTPDPSLGEPTVSYGLNPNSTRSNMVDASGTTTYGYDLRNRPLTKATPEGTLTYTYDASGNVASIDSSNTNGTSVAYAWDAANQLSTVTDNRLGGITTAAYTATGRPASLAQPNGVSATYTYNSLDRVLSMAWKKGAAAAFASWAYSYSPRGQRLTVRPS